MDIHTQRNNGTLIVKVESRRIDSSNARSFHTSLEDAIQDDDTGLVLNFSNVSYISSAGMRVILSVLKVLQKKEAKFAICDMKDSVREVFNISGFDKIVDIRDSQDDALTVCAA